MHLTILSIIFLVTLSGFFSGLNLAVMGLKISDLEVEVKLGNPYAKKILPLRRLGNQLLCTFLIGNVLVNTTLSVLLGDLMVGVFAIITGTTLITIFGEIIPQSVFSHYAFRVSAKLVPFIKLIVFILWPLAYPIGQLLNKVLGHEVVRVYSKKELVKFIEHQGDLPDSHLQPLEENIIKGSLNFSTRIVRRVMIPKSKIFMLDADKTLDKTKLQKIYEHKFSRIPVYQDDKSNIVGILYIKDLIGYDVRTKHKVSDFMRSENVKFIDSEATLEFTLKLFKRLKIYQFMVRNNKHKFIGIITLEDIVSAIVGDVGEKENMEELED